MATKRHWLRRVLAGVVMSAALTGAFTVAAPASPASAENCLC